jgi:hypothetical protein
MTENDEKGLSERQKKALPYFATCTSSSDACKKAGVSRNTFYEWMKNPLFKKELFGMQNSVVAEAYAELKIATTKAARALVHLLDEENPLIVKGAANDVLNHVVKFAEINEISERLDKIENFVNKNG